MELTVIGHWGGYPKSGEASSGYLMEHDGFKLLMDCGSAVLSQLQSYIKPEELKAVVLSHYHPDHVADIGVLQHALLIGKYINSTNFNLPIYGHQQDGLAFDALTYKNITTGIAYEQGKNLHIGPYTIEFLKTKHSVACFAMRISAGGKTLVYTADSAYFEELTDFAKDANILLCESNFYKGMDAAVAGHMTSEEAGILASKANVDKLILTHLPHFGDLKQLVIEAKENFTGNVSLASQGFKISV
ncbi:MBL fold metallo-hydrolase [Lederbergia lenta]|uniref:Metallo-beta-lactamase family protein n=1 Tax=Lederbergia lenta TaxID=1467 RepID=A0A2X4Z9A9_LEDLE|nr:MBL fold metallo-hydrolase [Lederbergia lenta]MCM3110493.1 MBL fold metallo-hydrolase [Lederbergia lenta]MEC2323941.1 MBL fold metallo-hydrolase [Lederbergia lenta]SQI60985.1 metallo-beta-lactamase family protein [Lederbergia lenta]